MYKCIIQGPKLAGATSPNATKKFIYYESLQFAEALKEFMDEQHMLGFKVCTLCIILHTTVQYPTKVLGHPLNILISYIFCDLVVLKSLLTLENPFIDITP